MKATIACVSAIKQGVGSNGPRDCYPDGTPCHPEVGGCRPNSK